MKTYKSTLYEGTIQSFSPGPYPEWNIVTFTDGKKAFLRFHDALRKLATSFGISGDLEKMKRELVGKTVCYETCPLFWIMRITPAQVIESAFWVDAGRPDPKPDKDDEDTWILREKTVHEK